MRILEYIMIMEECPLLFEQLTEQDFTCVNNMCRLCQKSAISHKTTQNFKKNFLEEYSNDIEGIKMNGKYKPFNLTVGEVKQYGELGQRGETNFFPIIEKINSINRIAYNRYSKIHQDYDLLRAHCLLTREECVEKTRKVYNDYEIFCNKMNSFCDQLCG